MNKSDTENRPNPEKEKDLKHKPELLCYFLCPILIIGIFNYLIIITFNNVNTTLLIWNKWIQINQINLGDCFVVVVGGLICYALFLVCEDKKISQVIFTHLFTSDIHLWSRWIENLKASNSGSKSCASMCPKPKN